MTDTVYNDYIIDNVHHYGYETSKCHLNQASFASPTKFVNIFVSERNYILTLCFKMPCNNKGCNDGSIMSTHFSTQRMNLENYTARESVGIEQMR